MFVGACAKIDASTNIYATSISVTNSNITVYLNESVNLDDYVSVKPNNCSFNYSVSANSNKVNINNHIVSFTETGTYVLTLSVKSEKNNDVFNKITISVINKPVFVTSLMFNTSFVEININKTIVNKVIATPLNHTMKLSVSYSNPNIVNYNVDSGVITPIACGETEIKISANSSESTMVIATCKVRVVNNVYANAIEVENVTGDEPIFVATNSETDFNVKLLPANCNVNPTISSSNSNIAKVVNGKLVAGNIAGTCNIVITALSSETTIISKTITVNVVEPVNAITAKITDENLKDITYAYALNSKPYYVVINNANNINLDNLNVECSGCNVIEKSKDNNNALIKITFSNSGNLDIKLSYSNNLFSGNYITSTTINFTVYDKIYDINYVIKNNDNLISSDENETIYLVDTEFETLALNDGVTLFKSIQPRFNGFINPNGYVMYVTNNNVMSLENGVITALNLGDSSIIIESLDEDNVTIEIPIKVENVMAKEIVADNVNLYVNATGSLKNSTEVSYSILPVYAKDSVEISVVDGSYASVNNNVVTALKEGETTLTLQAKGCSTEITLTNYLNITNFKLLSDSTFEQVNEICAFVGDRTASFTYEIYSGDEIIDIISGNYVTEYAIELSDSLKPFSKYLNIYNGFLSVTFAKEMHGTIAFVNLADPFVRLEIAVNVSEKVFITELYFNENEIAISLDNANIINNALNINPVVNDDTIIYTSTNEAVARVNNKGNVTAVSVGECEIVATTLNGLTAKFKLVIFNNKITSLSFENSIVTCNLKYKTQVLNNLIINPVNSTEKVEFSSSNLSCATVNNLGVVKLVGAGETVIYVRSESGIEAFYSLIVEDYFEVTNAESFANMNDACEYRLVNDIDLNGELVDTNNNFVGKLNGNGYKLLNVSNTVFNEIASDAVVENLVIEFANSANISNALFCNNNLGEVNNVELKANVVVNNSSGFNVFANNNFGVIKNVILNAEILMENEETSLSVIGVHNGEFSNSEININSYSTSMINGLFGEIATKENARVQVSNVNFNLKVLNTIVSRVFGFAPVINCNANSLNVLGNLININFVNGISSENTNFKCAGFTSNLVGNSKIKIEENNININCEDSIDESFIINLFCNCVSNLNSIVLKNNYVKTMLNFSIINGFSEISGINKI